MNVSILFVSQYISSRAIIWESVTSAIDGRVPGRGFSAGHDASRGVRILTQIRRLTEIALFFSRRTVLRLGSTYFFHFLRHNTCVRPGPETTTMMRMRMRIVDYARRPVAKYRTVALQAKWIGMARVHRLDAKRLFVWGALMGSKKQQYVPYSMDWHGTHIQPVQTDPRSCL
jgi:hypothetical protein